MNGVCVGVLEKVLKLSGKVEVKMFVKQCVRRTLYPHYSPLSLSLFVSLPRPPSSLFSRVVLLSNCQAFQAMGHFDALKVVDRFTHMTRWFLDLVHAIRMTT